jgi:hypothetical protein
MENEMMKAAKWGRRTTTAVLAATSAATQAQGVSGGFDRVSTIFTSVNGVLIAAGVSIMTTAILWQGYKITFKGASFEEVAKPIIGAILIGGAATLAGFLIQGS